MSTSILPRAGLILAVIATMGMMGASASYCPAGLATYDKVNATESFEDLLKNQTVLLQDFEDFLKDSRFNFTGTENVTFLASFEELLRNQTTLHESFSDLLGNETQWDFSDPDDQVMFLTSFGELLMNETSLFESFEGLLIDTWCDADFKNETGPCGYNARWEFKYSYEDLLKRQVNLLKDYVYLLDNMDSAVDSADRQDLLSTLETLLKEQSNRLSGFETILKINC